MASLGGKVTEVVSEQHPAYQGGDTQFCGVFTPSIAKRCWLDADHMIIRYGMVQDIHVGNHHVLAVLREKP